MLTSDQIAPNGHEFEHVTHIITAGGWARSGKGTSMAHLRGALESDGQSVELIDQGMKFRAMGHIAQAHDLLGSPDLLDDFLQSNAAQDATLKLLTRVAGMSKEDRDEILYTPEMSKASGIVGSVASSHEVAVGLLRTQVETAVEDNTDVILIDGRSMEQYAHQYQDEGLARFVMGWFFKCDPAIAARRSLGLFDEFDDLSAEDRTRLLYETLSISDRNRSDTLRDIDPIREPVHNAYHLDLPTYYDDDSDVPYKRAGDILRKNNGLVVVDTSYTESIDHMTYPVTELSRFGLYFRGPLTHNQVRERSFPEPVAA